MHKPYLLFALMIGLTLSLLGSISPEILANMPTAQTSAVQLTDQSFNPTVITITVGAQVTWENKTSQSYTLQSGSPYAVYLPIIMMNSSNKRTELYGMVIQPQELFGGNFPPNGQLTHQFQSAGTQPYFITGHPNFSGRVIILPGTTGTNTPTASATSPNQATATPTTSATSPNQATTTPTASATSPNQTTATPTASATSSNQATATPTASATSPNQTTTTPTASATSPNQTTATPTSGATATATPRPLVSVWMMNTTNEGAAYIKTSGASILVNIVSTAVVSQNNYVLVKGSGIPNYAHTETITEIQTLNVRPKAATDFVTGKTTASAGQVVKFGQDIGFKSRNTCTTGAGYGYWPPGPECPTNQNKSKYFPLSQAASSTTCKTGLGAIGLWVNGVSVYNWGDGTTYNNGGVWHNLAPIAEYYDIDTCLGHAANGDYHHHGNPTCLAEELADKGMGHSPIYGFAADGYPIYGTWHANGSLAKSCWQKRDYSDTTKGGCGVANKRTCTLVDQYNVTKGTTPTASAGPDTTATFTSQSGNVFSAASGAYYEDYYYDSACTSQGTAYLDSHNGHDHDGLGYHYHVTVTQNNDGTLKDAFPFIVGPTFYGTLQNGAITTCSTGQGPGGGGPPVPREESHEHDAN